MDRIISLLAKYDVKKIDENSYKINPKVSFKDFSLSLNLKLIDNKFYLSDNKSIIRFMNEVYNLKALDVKKCINEILKLYNCTLSKGEIFKQIIDINQIEFEINNFIMMAGGLAFMYVFFEE